jgi:hypothetical protein
VVSRIVDETAILLLGLLGGGCDYLIDDIGSKDCHFKNSSTEKYFWFLAKDP